MASTDLERGINDPTVLLQTTDGGVYSSIPRKEQQVCDAILTNNWSTLEVPLKEYGKDEVFALRLNKEGLTPLMMAMATNTHTDFIIRMIEEMPPELLQLTDYRGNTALHLWDRRQNDQTEKHVAELLLQRCGYLRYFQNVDGDIPELKGVDINLTHSTYTSIEDDQGGTVMDAIEKGKWKTIEKLFAQNEKKFAIRLGSTQSMTPLHFAIRLGRHVSLMDKMIEQIPKELLALTDVKGTSVLHLVADNRDRRYAKLAEKIVHKNPNLLCYVDNRNFSAIRVATEGRNRPMAQCLISAAMNFKSEWQWNPLNDNAIGYEIYKNLLAAEFYDLAIALLNFNKDIVLEYNCLDRLLRSLLSYEPYSSHFTSPTPTAYKKSFREIAWTEFQARLLVRRICRIVTYNSKSGVADVGDAFRDAFLLAARNGRTEIVLEILRIYGPALEFKDDEGHSAFQLAVMYRYPKVFNALYNWARSRVSSETLVNLLCLKEHDTGKNILHLAGDKPCQEQYFDLKRSGPILQMQNEVRWFKELEKFLPIEERMKKNKHY